MNNAYQSLPHGLLIPGTALPQFQLTAAEPVSFDDPATSVFTDFSRTRPYVTSPAATIAQINAAMIACGVRLLFVAEIDGKLEGLVTYTDLYGEKPVSYLREHGGSREEILARDIMTPLDRLETLSLEDVDKASVGDIVETVKAIGRQHLLVSHGEDGERPRIAGMFSSTHIEKRLGITIELSTRARSFAEIERALA